MSKDFSQSASSEQSEPKWPFTVRRRDTSVLKNDPANLCIAYLAADSALSSAKPGTSAEELSKMRMRSSDALKNWREADDLWEQRLDDLVSSKYREKESALSHIFISQRPLVTPVVSEQNRYTGSVMRQKWKPTLLSQMLP